MKRSALALALILPLSLVSAACNKAGSPAVQTAAATSNTAIGDDPTVPRLPVGSRAHCAVTGEEFTVKESTVQVTYKGKRYAFCCADCQPQFSKNPDKFAVK